MSQNAQKSKRAAGGWGSLASTAKQLVTQGIPAKGASTLLQTNQPEGFDCPGCAWPDPKHTSSFEFCENGVKAVAWEATSRRVTPDFFAQHSVTELRGKTDHFLEAQGRLTHPMRYNRLTDHYESIAWDDLFQDIGHCLRGLGTPDEAAFYTSGRTSNEAAFLYQLFVRAFGTNNLPDCSNMCHESSGMALTETLGTGKGTVTLDDFDEADAIFIFGQNPGTNHPRMLTSLRKAAKRGARIVTFNPIRERGLEKFANPKDPRDMMPGGGTTISSHYFQLRIGGDLAALKGIMKAIVDWDDAGGHGANTAIIDHDFVREHTAGFDALAQDVRSTPWREIEAASGLSEEQLREAASVYCDSDRVICTWAMGLTQHTHAVATIQQITNLLLLRGNVGKPGAGACPVRGHSNVQGDRTMGITEKPSPVFLNRLAQNFDLLPPRTNGLDTVGTIEAMARGDVKVFFAMGGNFAAATPDTAYTEAALENCQLTAHVSTKLNRSHLVTGQQAYILPCLGRTELDVQAAGPQAVTVEDSMSMVHASSGTNAPASDHLLSEPMIVARLAAATLPDSSIDWLDFAGNYDRIRDRIADVIDGFDDFNARIREPGGFYLGNSAGSRHWNTKSGKANFVVAPIPSVARADNVLTLMTVRSHDQYNTTVYGLNDRYRGVFGQRRVIFLNRQDMGRLGFSDGQWVDLHSTDKKGQTRTAKRFKIVAYDIPAGCAAAYFPETNGLVPVDSYAVGSRTPTSKDIPVTLQMSET